MWHPKSLLALQQLKTITIKYEQLEQTKKKSMILRMQHVGRCFYLQLMVKSRYTFCQFCVFKLMTIVAQCFLDVMQWTCKMKCMLSSNQWKALYHFVTLQCYRESAPITALLPTLCVYNGFFTVSDWTGVKVREIKDGRLLLPRLYLSALITDIRRLCPYEQGDREKRMLESQRETEEVKEWNIPERRAAVWKESV